MMDINNQIQESVNARTKLAGLVEAANAQSMNQVGEYIDTLTENECRWMLKMIAYGSWKDFAQK